MKYPVITVLMMLSIAMSAQNRIGVNTNTPQFSLDVRGTDNMLDGGSLQLGTPDETNFLRFFGGRLGDRNPFLAFHEADTFHLVSTSEDWTTYTRHLTVLPDGKVGLGTDVPLSILDISGSGDGAALLRLSSERPWVFKQLGTGSSASLALQPTMDNTGFTILSEDGSNAVADFSAKNDLSMISLVPDSGYVGIGTDSPTAPLTVHSNQSIDGRDTAMIVRTTAPIVDEFDQSIAIYAKASGDFGALGIVGEGSVGVIGKTTKASGTGVQGLSIGGAGNSKGVYGSATGTGTGVYGHGLYGVKGTTLGSPSVTYAVHGNSTSATGFGVHGTGNTGVYGNTYNAAGIGVHGHNSKSTGSTVGVKGTVTSATGYGVYGDGGILGVYGRTANSGGSGVRGYASSTSGVNNGVSGETLSSDGRGIYGKSSGSSAKAVYAYATGIYGKGVHSVIVSSHSSANAILAESGGGSSYAGYFIGKLHVAGALSKSSGSFKIDHPLDPANKYLYHSFVESPDMLNIYNGNVVTDESRSATVVLPEYFDALNTDFRYQLTVIGTFAQAIVSEEVSGNVFSIMTDKPNIKVSWQVTGVRKDPYAKANRIEPEVTKEPENIGRYLNPEVYGKAESVRIGREVALEREQ